MRQTAVPGRRLTALMVVGLLLAACARPVGTRRRDPNGVLR